MVSWPSGRSLHAGRAKMSSPVAQGKMFISPAAAFITTIPRRVKPPVDGDFDSHVDVQIISRVKPPLDGDLDLHVDVQIISR
eukprot:12038540-Heterocapsa_arctica.AAC.1